MNQKIKNANTVEELKEAIAEASGTDLAMTLKEKAQEIIAQSKQARKEAEALLAKLEEQQKVAIVIDGKKYELSEWVTLSDYCKHYGIKSTSRVSNWILRGIIPQENIINVSRLNNLTLIRLLPYKG